MIIKRGLLLCTRVVTRSIHQSARLRAGEMVGRLSSASGEDERRLRGQLNDPVLLSAPKSSDEPIFRNRMFFYWNRSFFSRNLIGSTVAWFWFKNTINIFNICRRLFLLSPLMFIFDRIAFFSWQNYLFP